MTYWQSLWTWARECPNCQGEGSHAFDMTRAQAIKRGIPRDAQGKGRTRDHVTCAALCAPCHGSGRANTRVSLAKVYQLALVILARFRGHAK